MFGEMEQEHIRREFLNTTYVNVLVKPTKTKTISCPCKLEGNRVELRKLSSLQLSIIHICKLHYQELKDRLYLRRLPKLLEEKQM